MNERGPEFLRQRAGNIKSRMGGVVPGSHAAMRGRDLHATFRDAGWLDLYMFAITGRRFVPSELALLESIWVYTSYPDARIWNNRVAALAGSARSTGSLAMSAALAVSEASVYGRGVDIRAITFLRNTQRTLLSGGSLAKCIEDELRIHRSIAGFGRPLTSEDERIAPILARARELGLDQGPHLKLSFEVNTYLMQHRMRMQMNYGAIAAALVADVGLTPRQYYLYLYATFLAGMFPCYLEAVDEPEGALFPVSCENICYLGREARSWRDVPRSREAPQENLGMGADLDNLMGKA